MKNKNKARVLINANQKGGVGKTTTATMEAVIAALPNFNFKVLLIDWDGQGNATSLLGKTFNANFPCSIMHCIENNDLQMGITELSENLHMIAGAKDIKNLVYFLENKYPNSDPNFIENRTFHFSKLLDSIKDNYDFIIIDVGPSTDIKVDNAMVCADYITIIQETQTYSYEGSKDIAYEYFQTLIDDFGSKVPTQIMGVLCVLFTQRKDHHNKVINDTYNTFGRNYTYTTNVTNFSRLEEYPDYGINVVDYHDRRVFATYADIFAETLERISFIEEQGDIPEDYIYQKQYLNGNKLTKLAKELDLNGYTK
ncbi:replication protein Rep63B [Carnobacterium divergens]|nr:MULTISPECIES: AAA family ATPase [Carnobacterium]KRN70596.1 Rep63B [Carnobacterium maltaromaticum DSM 20342]MBC9788177.1 AAA family ATPase [Carnobacterium maltaromaticum]TFI86456.1 replication protein Rep63B [Carnobacterium divergens]TFJ37475.1 replication protein Rep63B [Carnobacterium divergens]TFJ46530.1 replication protein Rep63B [Carnobacterium divergens]